MKLSLRAKGILAFLALVTLVGSVGVVLGGERQRLLQLALRLEQIHGQQATLAKASHAINHSLLRLQGMLLSKGLADSFGDDLALDVELIQSGLQGLQDVSPQFHDDIAQLGRNILELEGTPSREALLALQERERTLESRLTELERGLRASHATLWVDYYRVYDRMTLLAVIMNLIGALSFGAAITLFFTRLAWDLRNIARRAERIVAGYRGAPLAVTRTDEVGDLIQAINRMQLELRQRERVLELSREQHFHREKMAAVGSLAAAVAHEINNPIAAIAGIARTMCDAQGADAAPMQGASVSGPQLILEQTQRIAGISRQIAEFTRPHVAVPELLDLNALVRSTCKFIRYDQRLRKVDLVVDLDDELPALTSVADHLTQVLMNLVINSADALEGVAGREPTIRVATRLAAGGVVLTVRDNGHGMDAATLARAFEESFSTKPADKGRGLGLYLCKALLERDGGRIGIDSTPGVGTTVTVQLPLQEGKAA